MTDKKSKHDKEEHNSGNYEPVDSKLKEDIYKKCISTHQWALGIIVGLIISFVSLAFLALSYLMWKGEKEYKEACAKAVQSSEKAREYELKAGEALASIDQSIAGKLEQIEKAGNEQIQALFKESERQRAIRELFDWAQWAMNRKKYESAAEYYRQIVEELKEEGIPDVYNNWGAACLGLAKQKEGKDAEDLLKKAEEKCLKAESIETGTGAYNLGCVYAHRGNEDKCQEWLKVGEKAETLVTREHAMADEDLKSVRDKDWFKKLRWKGE